MTPLVADHHRLLLGPAWDRRRADLPPADVVRFGELCHEPDLDAALAAIAAELPTGGRLAFVEHVGRRGLVHRFPWGCQVGRDVPAAVRRAGFLVTDLERFTMPTPVPVLRSWVSGIAVKQ